MKTNSVIKLLLLVPFIVLTSCKKEKVTPSSQIVYPLGNTKGSLIVNARDSYGNSIIGEEVWLYRNEADFINEIIYLTAETNNSGQVRFSALDPGVYYVDCVFENTAGGYTYIKGKGAVSAGYETTIIIRP